MAMNKFDDRLDYGSDIPSARKDIGVVLKWIEGMTNTAIEYGDDIETISHLELMEEHLMDALGKMTRRKAIRVAPRRTGTVTDAVKLTVRNLAAQNPDMGMQQIAVLAGTNSGRVSEILNGLR